MDTISDKSNAETPVLRQLLETIEKFSDQQIKPTLRIPADLHAFGIRSLDSNAITAQEPRGANGDMTRWHDVKNSPVIEDLKSLFLNNRIIPFTNWSNVYSGSDLWYGLLADVIKPLKKKDFEFIFYLGDITQRRSFEVDEILDIISAFSHCGRVTFAMDEDEAIRLWTLLFGKTINPEPTQTTARDLRKRYLAIFNTMNIENLIVYSDDQAMLFTNERYFEIARRKADPRAVTDEQRDNFCAGYGLGLEQKLDIPQCIGLGLTVCGVYAESGAVPDKKQMLEYLQKWAAEADQV
jgi:hypothetical protein